MIWDSFRLALAQAADPRFRGVILQGVALALGLLVALGWGFVALVDRLVPDDLSLPLIGQPGGLDRLADAGAVVLFAVLSVFLMVPVASAFIGLFLDRVVRAVEARHYPALPDAAGLSVADGLISAVNFLGVMLVVNLVALILYLPAGPLAPVMFWLVNGWLLGKEYFTLVAERRLGRPAARALWRKHRVTLWLAGTLMAAPLSVPLVGLVIPVLGVATFTHLFQRLPR